MMLHGTCNSAEIICWHLCTPGTPVGQHSSFATAVLCMRSEQVAQQGEAVRVLQEELTTVKKIVLTMHAGILHAQQQQQQSHHHQHHGAESAPGQATAPQTPVSMQLPAAAETLTPEQPQQQLHHKKESHRGTLPFSGQQR